MSDEEVYPGDWVPLQEGGSIYVTPDGEVLTAVDAAGQEVEPDPEGYQWVEAEDEAVERELAQAAIEDRIAELEQRAAEPREPVIYVPQEEIDRRDQDRVVEDWERDVADIEGALDRKLTQAERRELGTHAAREGFVSMIEAAQDLALRGRPLVDIDDESVSEAERDYRRQQHMVERLQDAEGSSGDPVTGAREPTRHAVDFNNDRQRQQWMADALSGADMSEVVTFDGSIEEET